MVPLGIAVWLPGAHEMSPQEPVSGYWRLELLLPRQIKGPDISQVPFISDRFVVIRILVFQYGLQHPLENCHIL